MPRAFACGMHLFRPAKTPSKRSDRIRALLLVGLPGIPTSEGPCEELQTHDRLVNVG